MSAIRRITADNLEDFLSEKVINRFETDFDDYIENQADEISIKNLNDLIERDLGDNSEDKPSRKPRERHFNNSAVDNDVLTSLEKLRESLSSQIIPLENLRPPAGLPTGLDVFDDFLLWRGIPKGDISLFHGQPGAGATSLWAHSVKKIHEQNKWAAWINSEWELMPSYLIQKNLKLNRLLVVKKPQDNQQLFWVLQELITSSLFESVGCHLKEGSLKNHQLQKLKKLARQYQVALVIISHGRTWLQNPLFALVIDCSRDFFTIKRALHRPTPFSISGSAIYEDLMPQLTSGARSFLR